MSCEFLHKTAEAAERLASGLKAHAQTASEAPEGGAEGVKTALQEALLYHQEQLVALYVYATEAMGDDFLDHLDFGPVQEAVVNTVETAVVGAEEAHVLPRPSTAAPVEGGEQEEAETPANILALKKKRLEKKLARIGAKPALGAGFALPRAGPRHRTALTATSGQAAREIFVAEAEAEGKHHLADINPKFKEQRKPTLGPSVSQETLSNALGNLRATPSKPPPSPGLSGPPPPQPSVSDAALTNARGSLRSTPSKSAGDAATGGGQGMQAELNAVFARRRAASSAAEGGA